MSELDLGNEAETFKLHLESILKNIQVSAGFIDVSTVFNMVLPVFFETTKLSQWQVADQSTTTTMTLRNVGYTGFYQSLSNYTVLHFNTLNTAFMERILLQAVSLSPLVKVAQRLRLDDPLYHNECHISDRLSVLIGALSTQFGYQAVDNFLHPLFTQDIFSGKHFAQSDSPLRVHNFGTMVKSRGGTYEVNYQQLQDNTKQPVLKWECAVTYQLAHNSPYVQHRRTGKNKRQAKSRVLYDIDNYYTNNGNVLVQHCSALLNPTSTQDGQSPVEVLSIPIDQLYQYDDDIQQSIPTTQLARKRSHDNTMESHVSVDHGGENNNHVSFLTHALLYDFSKLSCNEPTNSIPSTTTLQHLPLTDRLDLMTPVPSPSSTTPIKMEAIHDDIMQEEEEDGSHIKKQRTNLPTHPDVSLSSTDLTSIAFHLVSQIPAKDRLRFKKNSLHLSTHPHDAKGCLKNLATKFNGHYFASVQQYSKNGITHGYFTANVQLEICGWALGLARSHVKKSDAEGMAALAIFVLLDAAISAEGDPQHSLTHGMMH